MDFPQKYVQMQPWVRVAVMLWAALLDRPLRPRGRRRRKGYKLHTVWSNRAVSEAWEITPLNVGEKAAAGQLIGRLEYGGQAAH